VQRRLVGRQSDLDLLLAGLADPAAEARAIEIVGDAGIGKSALIDAALSACTAIVTVRTAATAVEQPLTWAGLAQLVANWPDPDLAALPTGLRRALDGALGRDDAPEPGLVGSAVAALVANAAARGPTVIVVDDAHWIDHASAGVLAFAVRANRRLPVRLLSARRPLAAPLQPERLVEPTAFTAVNLTGLTAAGVHDVLASEGIELTRPQLVHVRDATGGNPLHVLEFARMLGSGAAVDDAVRQTSLESILGTRVRSLSSAAQHVIGTAALVGQPTLALLSACFDGDHIDVGAALAEAEQAGLVTIAGSVLRFSHPTVGAAADAALGTITRRRLHARLADLADPDERALHLDASSDGPDPAVADALDASGRHAWDLGATEVAARRMIRSIERTPHEAVEVRWRRRDAAANMLLDIGAAADGLDVLDPANEPTAPADPELAALVLRSRACCRFASNDDGGAIADFSAAGACLPAGHHQRVDALLMGARALLFVDIPASLRLATQVADEARLTGDQQLIDLAEASESAARFLVGEPVTLPEPAAAESRHLRGAEIVHELMVWSDELDAAEPHIAAQSADGERRGQLPTEATSLQHLANIRLRRGDLRAAHRMFQRNLDLAGTLDDRLYELSARAGLALTNALTGRFDAAAADLAVLQDAVDSLATADQLTMNATAGTASLLCGAPDRAVGHFRSARAASLQLGLRDCTMSPFRAEMVEALLALGEIDEAREVADELVAFAGRAQRRRGIADAHRATALVAAADGDLARARECIDQAIREHDLLPGPLEGAWSRLIAGVIERRLRQRASARAHLEQARDTFRRIGAEALAERAETELARTGGRQSPLGDLTPAEQQVARLVTLGHTNAEVAALLHMSAKTVEANLTRVYRKLGVRSRTELAARALP
jgi:DNA-binding CsgD family transcriptional regulator